MSNRRVAAVIAVELAVLAVLVLLSKWRWGGVAWVIAAVFLIALAGGALWRREWLDPLLAVLGAGLIVLAATLAVSFHRRSREQADTVASMKRIAAALAQDAAVHRGLYPDGAHFAAVVQRFDAGAPLNDAWGRPFRYTAIDRIGLPTGLGPGPGFILQSAGAEGILQPNYIGDVYNWPHRDLGLRNSGDDLLMINGVFIQAPRSAWQ